MASRALKKARIASTASCWRCSVTTEWPRPSSSTAVKAPPSSRRRVSKRVPLAGSSIAESELGASLVRAMAYDVEIRR